MTFIFRKLCQLRKYFELLCLRLILNDIYLVLLFFVVFLTCFLKILTHIFYFCQVLLLIYFFHLYFLVMGLCSIFYKFYFCSLLYQSLHQIFNLVLNYFFIYYQKLGLNLYLKVSLLHYILFFIF